MPHRKSEALKSLNFSFSFPGSNSILTLAKLNIHRSEKVRTTDVVVSFSEAV